VEHVRIGLGQRVGEVEEDVAGEVVGLGLAARAVEPADQLEEVDRQAAARTEHVALAV
jgi:hypothetical protein